MTRKNGPWLIPLPVLLAPALFTLPAPAADTPAPDAETWWSLRPIVKPTPPAIDSAKFSDWPRTPIDRFVLAKLLDKGLEPAAPADRRTLLRRVTFDLTGLPPTPEAVEAALGDESPDWYEKVVD